jgi:glycosyltransferase involved in cell wall biosynthesis
LWAALPWFVTDLHVMSAAGADEFLAEHPRLRGKRRHVVPHGNYRPVLRGNVSRDEARATLGLPRQGRVLALFGRLRPYKGIEQFLEAGNSLGDGITLVVAGYAPDDDFRTELESAARAAPRVKLIAEKLSDEELEQVITAADQIVLPYANVLNSGSAILALTLGRPVVLPRTPTFEELSELVGGRWVTLFDHPLDAEALRELPPPDAMEQPPAMGWSDWDAISEQLRPILHEAS